MVVDILAATTVVLEGHSSRAVDILAATTVVLQGHSSRTDAKSRAGLYVALGRGPTLWKSRKQKSVTKSSCEAEILALSDMASMVIWMRDAIEEMNMTKTQPITIYEDNKAAIQLVSNGMSTSDRSRRIHVRNNFVGQFVENGQIKVVHCPTKRMIADILTKPLGPS